MKSNESFALVDIRYVIDLPLLFIVAFMRITCDHFPLLYVTGQGASARA